MSAAASSPPWSRPNLGLLAVGLLLPLLVLVIYRDAVGGMVTIWRTSDTYTHGFLVPLIAAWLAWRKRAWLRGVPVEPAPWVLGPMAVACALWLVGELAEVNAAMQFGVVAMIVLSVPALFGLAVARVLAPALLFLFFAVPFGDFAVPYLQQWTADVTVGALRATGIPVYREGMQFIIPTGTWSVIEACSGIRYIIASVMIGALFAYLNYTSTRKRLTFMVAAVLVPIVANWVRAYTIVMIGHLTGSPMILGVEHTTYGWWLFGLVVALMFAAGARWADPPDDAIEPAPPVQARPAPSRSTWLTALGLSALLVGTSMVAHGLQHEASAATPRLQLPVDGLGGWQADTQSVGLPWKPAFASPQATATRGFTKSGQPVQVWVAYYRQQNRDRRLVSSTNQVVDSEDTHWAYQADGSPEAQAHAGLPRLGVGTVRRGASPSLTETQRYRVWHVYWIGGRWTTSPATAKLWQAFDRLRGQGDDGAVVLLVAPLSNDADAVLGDFAVAHLGAIDQSLAAARSGR